MTASENAPPASQGSAPHESRPAAERANRLPKGRSHRSFPWLGTVLAFALIVIVVLAAALWRQQQLVDAIGRESARRFNEIDSFAREAQARARQALSVAQGTNDRLAVLESKVLESQSQQAALEQLYQELSRGEDEWILIEVEQALSIAAQPPAPQQQQQHSSEWGTLASAIAALFKVCCRAAASAAPAAAVPSSLASLPAGGHSFTF